MPKDMSSDYDLFNLQGLIHSFRRDLENILQQQTIKRVQLEKNRDLCEKARAQLMVLMQGDLVVLDDYKSLRNALSNGVDTVKSLTDAIEDLEAKREFVQKNIDQSVRQEEKLAALILDSNQECVVIPFRRKLDGRDTGEAPK